MVSTGAPGTALLYALTAVLIWPAATERRSSVATCSPLTAVGAKLVWLTLWAVFVFETLRPANRAPSALHATIEGMASGEPGWIKQIDSVSASVLNHHGTQASLTLAALCAVIGAAVFAPPRLLKPALTAAIVLAAAIWAVGQDFGTIATGHATDPNSAPLLALLACCYWPHPAPEPSSRP